MNVREEDSDVLPAATPGMGFVRGRMGTPLCWSRNLERNGNMENGIKVTAWAAERGYATRDGDRVALMERGQGGPRAILWSYDSGSPQFIEYADRSDALATFMRSYDRNARNVTDKWAPGW